MIGSGLALYCMPVVTTTVGCGEGRTAPRPLVDAVSTITAADGLVGL